MYKFFSHEMHIFKYKHVCMIKISNYKFGGKEDIVASEGHRLKDKDHILLFIYFF